MLSRRRLLNFAALVCLAFFVFGLVRLFALRFDTGDIFPPYSSLRADPLGSEIFYESLRALPGRTVGRHKRTFDHLGTGEGTTLFFLGTRGLYLSKKEQGMLDRFVRSGGRLVMAFYPRFADASEKKREERPASTPAPKVEKERETARDWQVKVEIDRAGVTADAKRSGDLPIEPETSWHSGIYFQPQSPAWRVIYRRQQHPVMIERAFGAGSIVLAGDSFFLSNEALLAERKPALLAWLTGPNPRIVFDESHLAIHEDLGVAALLRKYGLVGFVLALLVLIALWVWRNATRSLGKKSGGAETESVVSGRDSFTGFITLLRRGIAPGQLIEVCLTEWRRSQPARLSPIALPELSALEKNPGAAYNQLIGLIGPKKWKKTTSS